MDDRKRYETVKSRLRAMGEGTAQQVHNSMEPTPYSVREVENTLDEMALAEQDEFEKVGHVYRWKKHYRFRRFSRSPLTTRYSLSVLTPVGAAFRVYRVQRRTHPATKPKPRAEAPGQSRSVGLARAISKMGHCSRSQAAELIAAGRVRLNGAVRRNAEAPVRFGQDRIEVDGRAIRAAEKAYWMLNKPRGVVTTASDEKGRATIYDFMGEGGGWLAPVGRLDKASEGLLLLTNDSEWAASVLDPAGHVAKTYHVQIAALANEALLQALRCGVRDGADFLRAERVRELRRGERNSWLEITLTEGKNRQIRRMLEAQGVEVLRLIRVAIGELELGELAKGASRKLSLAEKAAVENWKRTR